jgi:hypothetical protein
MTHPASTALANAQRLAEQGTAAIHAENVEAGIAALELALAELRPFVHPPKTHWYAWQVRARAGATAHAFAECTVPGDEDLKSRDAMCRSMSRGLEPWRDETPEDHRCRRCLRMTRRL